MVTEYKNPSEFFYTLPNTISLFDLVIGQRYFHLQSVQIQPRRLLNLPVY